MPLSAHAGGDWFLGGGDVEIVAPVEVPLLRGTDDPRPQVLVDVGGRIERAVLDLAGQSSRVGWAQIRQWNLATEVVQGRAGWTVRAVVPEVSIDGLIIRDLRVEVVDTPLLVLGTAALSNLAVALLPSRGVVVLSDDSSALMSGMFSQSAQVQTGKPVVRDGVKKRGNGVSMATAGGLQVGFGDLQTGTWLLRTDWTQSVISPMAAVGSSQRFGGVLHAWTRPQLGEVALSSGWFRRDGRVWSPEENPLGALGYDALWSVDLVVSPSTEQVSIQSVSTPKWTDAAAAHLVQVQARWDAWRETNPESSAADRPALPGFTGAKPEVAWEPEALGQHQDLAGALWAVGNGNGAVLATRDASRVSGDRCEIYLALGLRRLRTAGALQKQDFVASLVRQPLEHAASTWQKWTELAPKERLGSLADRDMVEPATVCQQAQGYLVLAQLGQGTELASIEALVSTHEGLDARIPLALGLAYLRQGDGEKSLAPLRRSLNLDGQSESFRAMMVADAQTVREEQAGQWLRRLAGSDPWPLSTAVIAGELGLLDAEDTRAVAGWTARELVRGVHGKPIDLNGLGLQLEQQLAQSANAPGLLAQKVVWLRLSGKAEQAEALRQSLAKYAIHTPDVWSADLSDPDGARQQAARLNLSMGWPELVQVGNLSSGEVVEQDGEL